MQKTPLRRWTERMSSQITAIEQQKKAPGRFSVYVDGEFAFGISDLDLCQLGLFVGQELEEERIDEIFAAIDETKCRDYGAKLVAKRMYTKQEIVRKLEQKGFCRTAIQNTIDILEEYGYLNDEVYAELYLKEYGKKYGIHKLRYDLKNKGVEDEVLERCLEKFDNQEELLELIRQKTRGKKPDRETAAKLIRQLTGKGFSYDAVKSGLITLWEEADEIE